MGYAIVVAAALAVGAATYALTLRRSAGPATGSFSFQGSAAPDVGGTSSGGAAWTPGVTYVPVSTGAPLSWRSRSIGALGLVALITVCASAIGVALYQVGSFLWRLFIQKIQGG